MRNWSMVRTGSTSSQKSLFFNMRRVRAQIEREHAAEQLSSTESEIRDEIAQELGVPLRDVEMMEARLSGADFSLNAQQASEEGREWIETLEDDGPQTEDVVTRRLDSATARDWLVDAFSGLTDRERVIIEARKLRDDPVTLDTLGKQFGLSKERIRQLEAQALRKMRSRLETSQGGHAAEMAREAWATA